MQLKEFQQEVLDTFDAYLDALVEKRLNAVEFALYRIEKE